MKLLIDNYTFDASARTITFDDYGSILLEGVLLVTNVTDNLIIYSFADASKGGTAATNVLTLDSDTTAMADSDSLQIWYEDVAGELAVSAASLPLPAGAATSAKQDTVIASLSTIDGHVDGLEAEIGATSESAAAADTSTSGLNGLIKRLLARITTLLAVFPTTIDTNSGNKSASTIRAILATDQPNLTSALNVTETSSSTRLSESDFDTKTGSLTETAPTTDTASSGLNGRLQRIAQRITSLIALVPAALTGSGNFKAALVEDTTSNKSVNMAQVAGTTTDTNSGNKSAGTQRVVIATDQPNLTAALNVSEANSSTRLSESDFDTKVGSLTETAPATDIASAGLNGRLQRVAQRISSLITAVGSPFQAGGSIGNTSFASTVADGANVTLGAKADAKSTATDTTAVSAISVLKQISASVQAPPSQAVTNAGTFSVQDSEKIADNAGFTDGTTKVLPTGYIYDEVAGTALTENDVAAARINVNRAQVNAIEDGSTRGRYATVTASNAVKVDGSAVTQPVSISGNQAVNVAQINGVTPLMGAGNTGTGSQRVTIATDQSTIPVSLASVPSHAVTNAGTFAVQAAGDVAAAATDSGNPVKVGAVGKTANPTAVADGQRSNFITDKLGKQVVVQSIRDLKGDQSTTITSSTGETTIVTAVASTFLDLYGLIIANTSATACEVTIRDATGGGTPRSIYVPAGDTRGFMLSESAAIKQGTVNNNWTAQCGTSVASIKITALFVKNI